MLKTSNNLERFLSVLQGENSLADNIPLLGARLFTGKRWGEMAKNGNCLKRVHCMCT